MFDIHKLEIDYRLDQSNQNIDRMTLLVSVKVSFKRGCRRALYMLSGINSILDVQGSMLLVCHIISSSTHVYNAFNSLFSVCVKNINS